MSYSISYDKKSVLQALRYHFIKQTEIKSLMIVVNIYAIITAILLFMKKIRPEPFLLGSLLWLALMGFFWYILPQIFYKKTNLFKQEWEFDFTEKEASLQSRVGQAYWEWDSVTHYFESPVFFHLYFGPKSFFLITKEAISNENQQRIREILKHK